MTYENVKKAKIIEELSKKYNLYRQTYCGCKFSIENQNKILKNDNYNNK